MVVRKKKKSRLAEVSTGASCLQQARTCREQAREAIQLKRFRAAMGLFATATALCRRAQQLQEADDQTLASAAIELREIATEVSTYREFAVSMQHPLMARPPL